MPMLLQAIVYSKDAAAVFTEEGQKQILKQHNNLQARFSLFNERIGYVGVLIAWR